jgi:hypothetical protein
MSRYTISWHKPFKCLASYHGPVQVSETTWILTPLATLTQVYREYMYIHSHDEMTITELDKYENRSDITDIRAQPLTSAIWHFFYYFLNQTIPLQARDGILKILRSPGIDSASLCSLESRYDNPIPSRFLSRKPLLKYGLRARICKR